MQPFTQYRFAKMTKGRITHIVQQAGHLDQIDDNLFRPVRRFHLPDSEDDLPAGLLHFQRMCQPATDRGFYIQRKNLRFLLQTPDRGTLYDPGPVHLGGRQ